MYRDPVLASGASPQQLSGFDNQIIRTYCEFRRIATQQNLRAMRAENNLIAEIDGYHQSGQFVIAIRSFAKNFQKKIEFCWCKQKERTIGL
jgi:hypothetical protein